MNVESNPINRKIHLKADIFFMLPTYDNFLDWSTIILLTILINVNKDS